MSSFAFRPAQRSEAKPLIGLYAESGCGKTYSALLLARGFAGPKGRVGMIDTEAGRGEAYADMIPGGYDVLPMRDDFSPESYGKAIKVAEKAQLDALIIDSASHEWEGKGGVLDMAEKNQSGGKKGVLVWQKPKQAHNTHFMLPLLQTSIPLVIVCMRAKYPMREVKDKNGNKEWVKSDDLVPKQADDILSEMFFHGWIDKAHKLHVTRWGRPDLERVITHGEMISVETGERLRKWADAVEVKQNDGLDTQGGRLSLMGPDGAVLGNYATGTTWLAGFKKALESAEAGAAVCALWDNNQDLFYNVQAAATRKGESKVIDTCGEVGRTYHAKANAQGDMLGAKP